MEYKPKTLADSKVELATEFDIVRLVLKNREFMATFADHLSPSLFREQLRPIADIALKHWKQYHTLAPAYVVAQELKFNIGTNFTQDKAQATVETLKALSIAPIAADYASDRVADFLLVQRLDNALAQAVETMDQIDKNGVVDRAKVTAMVNQISRAGEDVAIEKPTFFKADLDKRTDERSLLASGEIVELSFGSGIPGIDELRPRTKGLLVGELGIWMAATGRGKSIALLHNAMTAVGRGHNVAYFSLELPEQMLAERIDSMTTRVQISQIIEERFKVQEILKEKFKLFNIGEILFRELPPGITVNHLQNELIRAQQQTGFVPQLIVVDYMDLMEPTRTVREGGWKTQQLVTQELRTFGGKNNCATWSASQGNRAAANKNDEGELMGDADVAESYLKLGVADWVITINRTKKQMELPEPKPAWLKVVKNRTGIPDRRVGILTDFSCMSFYEGDYEENMLEAMEEAALASGVVEGKKKKK